LALPFLLVHFVLGDGDFTVLKRDGRAPTHPSGHVGEAGTEIQGATSQEIVVPKTISPPSHA
jgi:hypothetical protein